MRYRILTLHAVLAAAGAANAQPPGPAGDVSQRTIQCIDASGQAIPPVCQTAPSRLESHEHICNCINGGVSVDVAVCAKGETPPAEGKTLNVARREASRDGSLLGDTVDGKPICVKPRGG
jgi:hypothetical protein